MHHWVTHIRHVVIAPVEHEPDELFFKSEQFAPEKIYIIYPVFAKPLAEKIKLRIEKRKIPVEAIELQNPQDLKNMFSTMGTIHAKEPDKSVLINVSAAEKTLAQAALSYAFVHGLLAVDIHQKKFIEYPVLGISYYDLLKGKKSRILSTLSKKDCCDSLEDMSRKIGLSPSLVNYHVYGNGKKPGLVELGLVELVQKNQKIVLSLTNLGRLLVSKPELLQDQTD